MAQTPTTERGLVSYKARDGQEIKLSFDVVKKFLVSGKSELVTDQEMMLYMGMCKARGLNPFKRDCYLIKYTPNEPAATVVSIDYFRSRAKHQSDCVGWKSGIIIKNERGNLDYREGCFIVKGEELLGGWFKARPLGWTEEYSWSVPLAPYVKKTREGAVTQFWRDDNQPYMIAKVAESQGLRRLWPDEFQGLFTADEIIDTTATPQPEGDPTSAKLPEPVRKINAKEQKRFLEACAQNKIDNVTLGTHLSLDGFKSVAEVTTDKLAELMDWATAPRTELPAKSDNPQDPKYAPTFEVPPEDDVPSDWPEGSHDKV